MTPTAERWSELVGAVRGRAPAPPRPDPVIAQVLDQIDQEIKAEARALLGTSPASEPEIKRLASMHGPSMADAPQPTAMAIPGSPVFVTVNTPAPAPSPTAPVLGSDALDGLRSDLHGVQKWLHELSLWRLAALALGAGLAAAITVAALLRGRR